MSDGIALEAREVSKRYGPVTALDRVSLAVRRAECVALIGESGSGKTTLLRCFNRLTDPDDGAVLVDGADTARARPGGAPPPRRLRAAGGRSAAPLARATERGAGALASRAGGLGGRARIARSSSSGSSRRRVGDRWPRELSGGQRQRVAVARALAARPDLVLLDEPFGALDAITRADLQASFRDLRRELAITTLLVTHDLSEAFLLADRIAVMHAGRIEQVAAPGELRDCTGDAATCGRCSRGRGSAREAGAGRSAARAGGPRLPAVRGGPRGRARIEASARDRGLEAVRRVLPAGRDVRPAAGGARNRGGAAARSRGHRDRVRRAQDRRHRRLSRVHRDRAARNPARAAERRSARRVRAGGPRVRAPGSASAGCRRSASRTPTPSPFAARPPSGSGSGRSRTSRARGRRFARGSRPISSAGTTGSPASPAPMDSAFARSARCCRRSSTRRSPPARWT